MKRLILVLTAVVATSGFAQEASKPQSETNTPQNMVQRIVQVKHASPNRLRELLGIFGIHIKSDEQLNTIALSGPAENVKAAEDAIRRLDVPPPPPPPPPRTQNVESTFYMIMASQKADDGGKLPGELDSVIKQLKAVSAYQSYRLLDTIVLRGREGSRSDTSGALPVLVSAPTGPQSGTYQLRVSNVQIDPEPTGGHLAHLSDLRFSARMPFSTGNNQWQFYENHIITSVDIREGQKVVLGKANVDGGDSALILVVTVKVVD